jgi:hypothetical protein
VSREGYALFYSDDGKEAEPLGWMRFWGFGAGLLFVGGLTLHGSAFTDNPLSIALVFLIAAGAMLLSSFAVLVLFSLRTYRRRTRNSFALREAGHQGVWTIDPDKPPTAFRDAVAYHARRSTFMGILDVTAHSVLVESSGPFGGLLHDLLKTYSDLPVSLLLLGSDTKSVDPGCRRLTVYQSVLGDMGLSDQKFQRRRQSALEAVDDLNEKRRPEAMINIRFYGERPTFTAVIFDDAVFVRPWSPREQGAAYSLFRGDGHNPSLFSIFKNHFMRLWATSVSVMGVPFPAPHEGSQAIRRQPRTRVPAAPGG